MLLTVNYFSISSRKPRGSDFWIGRSTNIVISSKGRYIENFPVFLFFVFLVDQSVEYDVTDMKNISNYIHYI